MQTKTFRGLSLAEVEGKVRAELGDDAVVVRQREGLSGGVGGFFQRRIFEVEATAGMPVALPQPQPEPAAEDFAAQLKAALAPELEAAAAEQRATHAAADFIPDALAAAAKGEAAVTEPAPRPDNGALAALFAPDVPRAPVEWPEDVAPAPIAALPEPEILPAPAPAPLPAVAAAAVPAHWPAGAAK